MWRLNDCADDSAHYISNWDETKNRLRSFLRSRWCYCAKILLLPWRWGFFWLPSLSAFRLFAALLLFR